MKLSLRLAALAIALVAVTSGCKKDDFVEVDGVCPIVSSTSPLGGETNVPIVKTITATFNEKMDPSTITQASFTLQGATAVSGTVSYTGTTAYFTPSSTLAPNTTYSAKITTAVRDLMGNALQTNHVWTFSTGATVSPMVIDTDPVRNDTGIVLNKAVRVSFSMPMDPLTLTPATFTLRQGPITLNGTVAYTDTTAVFTPASALAPNTLYRGTITTGARNAAGVALENNYSWTFTTGTIAAPTVISTDPSPNATNVARNKIIAATFSEPMDPLTLSASTFIVRRDGVQVTGTVAYNGTTVSFTPSTALSSRSTYTATITTAARNQAGIQLADAYTWTFHTIPNLGPEFVDLEFAARFGILAGGGIMNNAGFSEIHDMDVGISPGARASITGFPPAVVVNGAIYASDDTAPPGVYSMLVEAQQDLTDAYFMARNASFPSPATISGDMGGATLAPGIYTSTSTLLVQSGDLTLDAQGDEHAVWIFQIASDLTTVGGAGGNILLIGGAQAENIFWQTGASATIGDFTAFKGNILALTSITLNSGATAQGRMLARNGSVVLTSSNTISKP